MVGFCRTRSETRSTIFRCFVCLDLVQFTLKT